MSKMDNLQQALKSNSGKPPTPVREPVPAEKLKASPKTKSSSREGKELLGAWLHADFGTSLRMVQLRRRKDPQGNKIYLDDLLAEALNDLFLKYDVPTVLHD